MASKPPIREGGIQPQPSATDRPGRPRASAELPSMPNPLKHSELTGYPQRFVDQLNGIITSCITNNRFGALMVLAIENLPMIMNAYGMEASENIMRHVERAVNEIIGKQDMICRIQRDQFGILIADRKDEEIGYLAAHLNSHIQQWCSDNDYGSIHVVTTIATIELPEQAMRAEEALSKSYMAIHDRSMQDGNVRIYKDRREDAAFSRQEMGLANYLNQAIVENRLLLAYQPIVCAKTGEIEHYEALLRIRSDDGKISSAGALIPIAERMGLIDMIDETTLKMAIKELRDNPELSLAFNISNMTTQNEGWLELFSQMVCETPDIAPRLLVEITETAAQLDLHQTAYFVAEIQSLGCRVALDDFGSGYTSFRQLKTLSVDMVKIDGTFVKDLVDNADNRFFVKTMLDFTNGFGLQSVAEFVENGEIAKMLMELGVNMLQGYYLGRPETGTPWKKRQSSLSDKP